jgi:hypothetical protein
MRNTFSHHQTTEPEVMQPTEHYTNADVYRYSFFPRTIITWNTIPQTLRQVNTKLLYTNLAALLCIASSWCMLFRV